MKIYLNQNVYDATLDRIRFLFDEFEDIVVNFSGGKDSTVCLFFSLMVAREKGRLPLKVLFIDQEAEWTATIDYIREIMSMPEVHPLWYQMPLRIFNATSTREPWMRCWGEGEKWMREKEPGTIQENNYGTDRFAGLFDAIMGKDFVGKQAAYIAGVRCEESPTRRMALTEKETYKGVTWGKRYDKKRQHYAFYPLYDWSYTDIWKLIHDNGLSYCKIYDYMYRYGVPVYAMRVSNVHHETAIHSLYYMQEMEPDTWEKLTKRIHGINTTGQLQRGAHFVKELPSMFKDWAEYRDYLLDNLIVDQKIHARFKKKFDSMETKFDGTGKNVILKMHRAQVKAILANDYHLTILRNWERAPEQYGACKEIKEGREKCILK